MDHSKNRQIRSVKISAKEKVTIVVSETIIIAPEEESASSREITNIYTLEGEYKPHKDFMEAMLSTRKYALDISEFSEEGRTNFTVQEVNIKGDMSIQNARVEFTLSKWVKRTGKAITIKTGEVMLYGDEYKETKKMGAAMDKLIEETWAYLDGKNSENLQLAFQFKETAEAE